MQHLRSNLSFSPTRKGLGKIETPSSIRLNPDRRTPKATGVLGALGLCGAAGTSEFIVNTNMQRRRRSRYFFRPFQSHLNFLATSHPTVYCQFQNFDVLSFLQRPKKNRRLGNQQFRGASFAKIASPTIMLGASKQPDFAAPFCQQSLII